jgi:hypothetical protein
LPTGSSDKLYEITPSLEQIIRPESVGGTPANRMIHTESGQLNIGPYLIDKERNVRVLDPKKMPGRLTGTARHLTDPANKIHIATMEEGLYSVNVKTLEFEEHIKDGNGQCLVIMARGSTLGKVFWSMRIMEHVAKMRLSALTSPPARWPPGRALATGH